MLTICHGAFILFQKCAGEHDPLDGANGRKIPSTVSSRLFSVIWAGNHRVRKAGKFMQIYDNSLSFIPRWNLERFLMFFRAFLTKPRKIQCYAKAELMKNSFRFHASFLTPPAYNHWNLMASSHDTVYQQNNRKLFASPMVELSLKWKINLRLKYLRSFIPEHNFFVSW